MGRKSREKEIKPIRIKTEENKHRSHFFAIFNFGKTNSMRILILLICLIVFCICQVYFQSTVPISFSAQLSNAGNASFTYATKQSDTYSPACGCMADKTERWRGVTFAGRHFRVTNITQAQKTAYWLMASEPAPLDWLPSLFRPQVTLLRLFVIDSKIIDISELQTGKGDGIELISIENFAENEDAVALVTNKPVDLLLPGDFPIAAYIPVEKSTVSIIQPSTTFKSEWNPTLIREEYKPSVIEEGKNDLSTDEFAYPMIDLVGSTLILTTEDEQATLVSHTCQTALQPPNQRPGWRCINVIIVKSPFSTRVSLMPIGQNFTDIKKEPQQKEDYQKFEKPDSLAKPIGANEKIVVIGNEPIFLPTAVEQRGQGSVEVAILERLSTIEYTRLKDVLKQNDKIWAHDIRSRAPEIDHQTMQFRFPPIPPLDGFSVYGLLREITLNVEKGHLMHGASSIAIDAPSVLEMRNIRAFTPKGNVIPIPIVGNTSEQSLEFSMYATSELLINHVPIVVRMELWKTKAQIISLVAMVVAIISGVLTICHLLIPFRKEGAI